VCHEDERWTAALPLDPLGIHTAYKEDLQSSAAELAYGEHLRATGELFVPAALKVETSKFIHHTFIHKDLRDSTHVFLRQDCHSRPDSAATCLGSTPRNRTAQFQTSCHAVQSPGARQD